mmetsp:Transcript_14846/g.21789  ORF Transcript_14846/g.21789 Transcript_14846/m.21789 type:complete len:255 (+) Transcript_14846:117-881(+)|eukprot:CAMPEP_0197246924 /NCGR_PEP_ID=MMETSP1429-20130617/23545_1 /TAXON_ID=49237 /ORGANISM="Chaetoceros  sp., Strain UNC1202" /LENGTH=254 /DNA_ID=CAMNT_0042707701 /DNA_START=117 /DNA_END=881 /DNA_ORIENTATION=+
MSNPSPMDIEHGQSLQAEGTGRPGRNKPLKMIAEQTLIEKAAGLLAFISVAMSLVAIITARGKFVTVAAILSFLLSPYSYWQQTRITDIRALKETQEALTGEVDTLNNENDRLNSKVEDLCVTVGKLEDVENALDEITKTQGQSVESLIETVDENKRILARMERNVRAAVLQNMVSVLIASDSDGDFMIGEDEMEGLLRRLRRVNGCRVNEIKFKEIVAEKDGSLDAILDIVRDVLNGDNTEVSEPIFVFESLS